MTAATENKESILGKSGQYLLYKIKAQRMLLFFTGLFGLLGFPLFALAYNLYGRGMSSNMNSSSIFLLMVIASFIAVALSVVMAFPAALGSFGYLHSKTAADVIYALPLSNRQRFFTDYLSGLAVCVVPYALSCLIGGIMMLFIPKSLFASAESSLFSMLPSFMWIILLAIVMIYTLCVIVATLCGSALDATIYSILMFVLIPSLLTILLGAVYQNTTGVIFAYDILAIIGSFSPLGLLINAGVYVVSPAIPTHIFDSYYSTIVPPSTAILAVIFTVAAVFAAYLCYKSRKTENTGKPFVFKWVYVLFPALLFVTGGALFAFAMDTASSYTRGSLIFAYVILSVIIFFVTEAVAHRGFRKIGFAFLRFLAASAIGFGLFYLVDLGNGFGIDKYVPEQESISSVCLECYEGRIYNLVSYTDAESIELIRAIQSECVEKINTPTYINDEYSNISLGYVLKNGKSVLRQYYINSEQLERIVTLGASSSVKQSRCASLDRFSDWTIGELLYLSATNNSTEITNITASQISEAYKADINAETAEQLLYPTEAANGFLNVYLDSPDKTDSYFYSIPVKGHYTNLKKLLTDSGVALRTNTYGINSGNVMLGYRYESVKMFTSTDRYDNGYSDYYMDITDPDVLKLIETAQPETFVSSSVGYYVISFLNGVVLAVPNEYSDIAARLYSEKEELAAQDMSANGQYLSADYESLLGMLSISYTRTNFTPERALLVNDLDSYKMKEALVALNNALAELNNADIVPMLYENGGPSVPPLPELQIWDSHNYVRCKLFYNVSYGNYTAVLGDSPITNNLSSYSFSLDEIDDFLDTLNLNS